MKIEVLRTSETHWEHRLPNDKMMRKLSFSEKWKLLNSLCKATHGKELLEIYRSLEIMKKPTKTSVERINRYYETVKWHSIPLDNQLAR